jgi:hypothetical protein
MSALIQRSNPEVLELSMNLSVLAVSQLKPKCPFSIPARVNDVDCFYAVQPALDVVSFGDDVEMVPVVGFDQLLRGFRVKAINHRVATLVP